MKIYAVIMAGGVGSRFWPRSKEKTPKHLLKIFGDKTMVQETVQRLKGIVDDENIYIITNKIQSNEIKKQLPQIPEENILIEPFGRNTAACIGLASIHIEKKTPDAVTIVLPSDHIIRGEEAFQKTIINAVDFAYKSEGLVTIGIMPSRPETGYGYIQFDESGVDDNIYKVYAFAEKPNYATAVRFIDSGDFLWNSGIFIWRVDTILREMQMHMPDLYERLQYIKNNFNENDQEKILANAYGQMRNISIDYGIMEKSNNVYLTKGDLIWSDVGSWEEVYQLSEKDENGNSSVGNVFTEMTLDSYIYSPGKFAAVMGVDNLIVINADDSLLICRRDQCQDVKKVVDHLKIHKLTDYL